MAADNLADILAAQLDAFHAGDGVIDAGDGVIVTVTGDGVEVAILSYDADGAVVDGDVIAEGLDLADIAGIRAAIAAARA